MKRLRFWWNVLVWLAGLVLLLTLFYSYLEARFERSERVRWYQYAARHCIDISYRSDAMWMCRDGMVYQWRY